MQGHRAHVAAGIVALFVSVAAADVTFQPLPDLPGGVSAARAWALSPDGTAIAGRGTSAAGTEPTLWTLTGSVTGLGVGSDASTTGAMAVSNGGSVVYGVHNNNLF